MNLHTLQKLSSNPHYKMTNKQKAELESKKRKPVSSFGDVERHPNGFSRHNTGPELNRVTQRKGKK